MLFKNGLFVTYDTHMSRKPFGLMQKLESRNCKTCQVEGGMDSSTYGSRIEPKDWFCAQALPLAWQEQYLFNTY